MLALLVTLTLGLTFVLRSANTATGDYAREKITDEAFAQAKAALIGYAATYRDTHPDEVLGYLLCPDTNNDGIAELNCGVAGATMIGRLPYRTLGLADLRAAGGECLWYIVSGSHKYNPKTAPLNWDTRGRIRVQDMNGNALIGPDDAHGGAVAAILAPGSPLNGQNRPAGAFKCSGDSSNSIVSYLDGGYTAATVGTLTVVTGQTTSSVNNDRLAWISARELFAPIARRSDLLGTLLTQLRTCFNLTGALSIPATPAYRTDAGTKWVSNFVGIDEVKGQLVCPLTADAVEAWKNWKDHFRYVVCKSPTSTCIQVNGANCSGAILFGGRMISGNPRTAAEKLILDNYFDAGNTAALTTAANTFTGNALYAGATPDGDIAICLAPGP